MTAISNECSKAWTTRSRNAIIFFISVIISSGSLLHHFQNQNSLMENCAIVILQKLVQFTRNIWGRSWNWVSKASSGFIRAKLSIHTILIFFFMRLNYFTVQSDSKEKKRKKLHSPHELKINAEIACNFWSMHKRSSSRGLVQAGTECRIVIRFVLKIARNVSKNMLKVSAEVTAIFGLAKKNLHKQRRFSHRRPWNVFSLTIERIWN